MLLHTPQLLLKDFRDKSTCFLKVLPFKMRLKILKGRITEKRNKDKRLKDQIDEPISIFRRRRRFNLNDNFLVSREESERRLQLGCLGLAIMLVIACSIITFVYGLTIKVKLPKIVTPSKREDEHQCKFQIILLF